MSEPGDEGLLLREQFESLRRLVNQKAGLAFDDDALYLFERRLSERLSVRGCSDFSEYISLLQSDSLEQEVAFCLLTTKETYFFRQEYQLEAFAQEVLPRLAKVQSQHRRLTIWSAGCSSGEEAYTIAMLLLESPHLRRWRLRVVGTDLCQTNVDFAERGIYRQTSFRTLGDRRKNAYFERRDDGSFRVSEELRRMCHFSRANLMSELAIRSVGRVDAVFCRNVLIYFDEASRGQVTDSLFQRLLPGGYLLLGHSESLLNTETKFEAVHLENDLVYRRPPLNAETGRSR